MPAPSLRNKTAICAIALLMVANSGSVVASPRDDLARQLIQSTSLVNILRTDAEQASVIADRLPEALPAELRSAFRLAIDRNLSYDAMEDALVKSLADTLDSTALENNLRWWASSSGRAISKMESSVYASAFVDSTFAAYNPIHEAPHDINPADSAELVVRGAFAQFITELLSSTQVSRSCLLATVNTASDCPSREPSLSSTGGKTRRYRTSHRPRVTGIRACRVATWAPTLPIFDQNQHNPICWHCAPRCSLPNNTVGTVQ
jgi:hypothetical protein